MACTLALYQQSWPQYKDASMMRPLSFYKHLKRKTLGFAKGFSLNESFNNYFPSSMS